MQYETILQYVYQKIIEQINKKQILLEIEKLVFSWFPKQDYFFITDLEKLFGYSRNPVERMLKLQGIKEDGRNNFCHKKYYVNSEIKKIYLGCCFYIPVQIVTKFFSWRIDLSKTQIYRLVCRKVKKNCFGKQSVPLEYLIEIVERKVFEQKIRKTWMKVEDLARIKNVTVDTVRAWMRTGQIKYEMSKFQYYIPSEEITRISNQKTFTELSEFLNIPVRSIRGAYERNQIQVSRFVGRIVVPCYEVERIVQDMKVGGMFKYSQRKIIRKKFNILLSGKQISIENINFKNKDDFEELSRKDQIKLIIVAKQNNSGKELLFKLLDKKIKIWAGYAANRWRVSSQDCYQYAMIGVLEAIEKYSDFKIDFVGYVCAYMKWTILDNLKKGIIVKA